MLAAVMVGLVPEPLPAGAIGLMGGSSSRDSACPSARRKRWIPPSACRLGEHAGLGLRGHAGGSRAGTVDAVQQRAQRGNRLTRGPGHPAALWLVTRRVGAEIGAHLLWTAFAATWVTSSLSLTALVAHLLALEMGKKATGLEVSWVQWFAGFAPTRLPVLLALPWLVLKIDPPEIRTSAEVPPRAAQGLAKIGTVTRREWTMAALVVVALGLWIFGGRWSDATLGAPAAISLRVVDRVVTWDEIVAQTMAWRTFAWFATMLTLAAGAAIPGCR